MTAGGMRRLMEEGLHRVELSSIAEELDVVEARTLIRTDDTDRRGPGRPPKGPMYLGDLEVFGAVWEDPKPAWSTMRTSLISPELDAILKKNPGRWARLVEKRRSGLDTKGARRRHPGYEFTSRKHPDGYRIYARFMGDKA